MNQRQPACWLQRVKHGKSPLPEAENVRHFVLRIKQLASRADTLVNASGPLSHILW